MIIKIDKQKVVAAAEKRVDDLILEQEEKINNQADEAKRIKEEEYLTIEAIMWTNKLISDNMLYHHDNLIKKLRNILAACNATEEQTVTITDEDVVLLGL